MKAWPRAFLVFRVAMVAEATPGHQSQRGAARVRGVRKEKQGLQLALVESLRPMVF